MLVGILLGFVALWAYLAGTNPIIKRWRWWQRLIPAATLWVAAHLIDEFLVPYFLVGMWSAGASVLVLYGLVVLILAILPEVEEL